MAPIKFLEKPVAPFLTICAIVKNEGPFLSEWIAYHIMIGVEHFVIYDNDSEDDSSSVFSQYADFVTVIPWPGQDEPQRKAYQHFVRTASHRFIWAAFIDADEFIVFNGKGDLPAYLAEKNKESGIMMQWVIFGTSGHSQPPNGLVIENFLDAYSVSPTPNIKTVCRPSDIASDAIVSPHRFPFKNGRNALPESLDILCVFHYVLRSHSDLCNKISRGDAWHGNLVIRRNLTEVINEKLELYDQPDSKRLDMLKYVDRVREIMNCQRMQWTFLKNR